jgi:glutamate synthase domain-containing protein 1
MPRARACTARPTEHDACGVGFVAHIAGSKSHSIVEQGLKVLENLTHRGAVGADPLMGDGAGILIQIPDEFYRAEMAAAGRDPAGARRIRRRHGVPAEGACLAPGLRAGARARGACRGPGAARLARRAGRPRDADVADGARQGAGAAPDLHRPRPRRDRPDALERKLYVIRKTASSAIQALKLTHSREYYVPSMSCRTIIYKGLLLAHQVGKYYRDLQDPRLVSALALVHQRFSTNTFPEWPLAHPYRMVAHNGEINTVKGNFNWMRAREGVMKSPVLGDDLKKLYPISFEGQSDTATFDNALELLTMSGYSLAHAVMMMIPEAWEQHPEMEPRRRAFYEYHAAMMEPWDGPAAMVFTDGRQIGATLDRNGLRPGALHRHRRRPGRSWPPNPACCRSPRAASSRSGGCSRARCS